jgi:UDP-glucose 4-epimerase
MNPYKKEYIDTFVNQKIHNLLIVSREGENGDVKCLCDCGKEIVVKLSKIIHKPMKSCGCIRSRGKSRVGTVYKTFKILSESPKPKNVYRGDYFLCECLKCKTVDTYSWGYIRNSRKRNVCRKCNNIIKTPKRGTPGKKGSESFGWKGCGEISASTFNRYKFNAKKRNIEFNITIEYIWDLFLKQRRCCNLTGKELHFGEDKGENLGKTASLDRIDSKKGYTEDNVQWLHKDVNLAKWSADQRDFLNTCKSVYLNTLHPVNPKKIFLTGGAGFLGRHFIEKHYNDYEIVVYSRDEHKHELILRDYPNIISEIGDISDYEGMLIASKGCGLGVFAASMKRIEAVEKNIKFASKTIIDGAFNARQVSKENGFISSCFINTDKSKNPSTIYGIMKSLAGELFVKKNEVKTAFNQVLYGNVFGSTGSLFTLLNKKARSDSDKNINLFHYEMTRFGISIDDAINLIDISLFDGYRNVTIVPKLWSFKVLDALEIYSEQFGITYNLTKPRENEKIHEVMLVESDIPYTSFDEKNNVYIINKYKQNIDWENMYDLFPNKEYNSKDHTISKDELFKFLKNNNFYMTDNE